MPPLSPQSNFEDEDEINLGEIGYVLVRQAGKILAFGVVLMLLAFLAVMRATPEFSVTGSLYLGDSQNASGAAQADDSGLGFLSDFQSVNDVETQVDLIQTDAQLEQAILETGLNASVSRNGSPALSFWRWKVFYRKSIGAFAPPPDAIRVLYGTFAQPQSTAAAYTIIFGTGGQYRAVDASGSYFKDDTVLAGIIGQPASGGGVSFLIRPEIDGYVPPSGSRYLVTIVPVETLEAQLLSKATLTISAGGTVTNPTKVVNVRLLWPNPYDGRRFLNQLMQDYIASQLSWKTQSASATESFISDQLNHVRASLQDADNNLASYQSQTGIVNVPENAQAVIQQLSQYEVQRTSLQLQQEALQQIFDEIKQQNGSVDPYLISQSGDVVLGQLATSLSTAQVQLQALRVQFTSDASEVRVAAATVEKIQDSIRTLIENDLILATNNLANIDASIAKFQGEMKSMPDEALRVVSLQRSSDVLSQIYILLMQKEEEAEVSKAATIMNTRIVSPAQLPIAATTPKVATTILIGLMLGLIAGVAWVLGRRALSGRFQSDDEVRRLVSLPVYAMVPRRPARDSQGGLFGGRPQSMFAESFRLLRSNIYQSASNARCRVILVTSAASEDGKTTVACNLAKTLADDGKRVIIVDADLRRPRVHDLLKLDQSPGLTEWLISQLPVPFKALTKEQFLVLPSGVLPPNPSELLNEPALEEILVALRADFDFIVIDSPPLPTVSDGLILGNMADLILSVVTIENTPRRAFQMHQDSLSSLNGRIGLIINAVTGTQYGSGRYYGYGYGETRPKRGGLFAMVRRFTGARR